MDAIKNFIVDNLNGFSAGQIPLFIFQLLVAALLAHLLQRIINRKLSEKRIEYAALIAMGIALLTSMVKFYEPLAIIGAAVILLLLRGKDTSKVSQIGILLVSVIGVGCGIGSVIQTIIGTALLIILVLFTPIVKEEN